MSDNFKLLYQHENQSVQLFAHTVYDLRNSQGFYSRMYFNISEFTEDKLNDLIDILSQQDFKDRIDVILYLEG